MEVRRNGLLPLYWQVHDGITEQIRQGVLLPGQKLPSEARLAADLQINRLTVRRAVEQLAREGALVIRRGAGTYVAEARTLTPLALSVSRDAKWAGLAEQLAGARSTGRSWCRVRTTTNPPYGAISRLPAARSPGWTGYFKWQLKCEWHRRCGLLIGSVTRFSDSGTSAGR